MTDRQRQIVHGPTGSGNYNLVGMADGFFYVQGSLTRDQLVQLRDEINAVLDEEES